MWAISGERTLASFRKVIEHEIEQALARRYPEITPEPFELLGKGFAYAFGTDYAYRCPNELRSRLPDSSVEALESAIQSTIERAVLTGDGPRPGLEMPPFRTTVHKQRFKNHLEELRPTISQLPSEQWDAALRVIEFSDIEDRIENVLQRHKLTGRVLTSLGAEGLSAFLDELPSRSVDLHLHRQALRNQNGNFHINDLEDWSGLGLASAYCDVLVCEKHFASLVQRSGFRPKAEILTELAALPELESLR
jgi:hypothetical protein